MKIIKFEEIYRDDMILWFYRQKMLWGENLLYLNLCPINNGQGIVIDGEGSKVICKD